MSQTRWVAFLWIGVLAMAGCQGAAVETAPGGEAVVVAQAEAPPPAAPTLPLPADLLPNGAEAFDGILVGGQPTPEQLAAARDAGYKTVINLRGLGEPGVAEEPALAADLGLAYVAIPVDGADGLTEDNARRLDAALAEAEYPVIVHCASGNRVGGLFALRAFHVEGKEADEALAIGLGSGLTRLEPVVREKLAAAASGP